LRGRVRGGMSMDTRNHGQSSARAEFYLCLARAFLAPRDAAMTGAMREALADDLADLAGELGLPIAAELADYRREIARLADPLALLQTYSALFLTPPAVACINAGQYLDGAIDGGSVREMDAAYRRCGVQRDAAFRDLSDHVSVQLEFVAMLYAASARHASGEDAGEAPAIEPGHFLYRYPARWIDRFCADLQGAAAEGLAANPYLPLARILRAAVASDAVPIAVDPKAARKQRAIERARAKAAGRDISADDLAEIRRRLSARGLSTAHLDVPPEQRDAAMGLGRKNTPGPR
jgi:putative dimethyl sulfoxide reductase chaperone